MHWLQYFSLPHDSALRCLSGSLYVIVMLLSLLLLEDPSMRWLLLLPLALLIYEGLPLLLPTHEIQKKKWHLRLTNPLFLITIPLVSWPVIAFPLLSQNEHFLYLIAIALSVLLLALATFNTTRDGIALILGYLYVLAFPLAFLFILSYPTGTAFMLWLFVVVWSMDAFAFFFGAVFRRFFPWRLLPLASPNKTWIGFFGGFFCAIAFGTFFSSFFPQTFPLQNPHLFAPLFLAAALACIVQIGDLVLSFLKRRCGLKNTGNIMPGHGGIWDRWDGFLPATCFYALYLFILL